MGLFCVRMLRKKASLNIKTWYDFPHRCIKEMSEMGAEIITGNNSKISYLNNNLQKYLLIKI